MSRVDEALSRNLESGPVRSGSAYSFNTEGRAAITEAVPDNSIADYPREHAERATAFRREVVAPTVALAPRPVLAAHPTYHFDIAIEGKVVVDHETSPVSVEQYRRLAATLHGLQIGSGLRTVMVSSALPRDGKTLTTTNLALTLSEAYRRRVLLIDADLRRPSIHEVFGLKNDVGLSDGLRSGAQGGLPIMQVSPTLAVLTAGAPDRSPMAGLTSDRMAVVLKEASARFDWVLLDTPPIGLISDAQLLAGLVDGVLLVVGAGSTDYMAVDKTVKEIGRERILGVVLNRVQYDVSGGSSYEDYYLTADSQEKRSAR
jgi:capsular exopolysaccharide synthesis family protein